MSNQGSSSVRVVTGTTFMPMSSDPLSREVSTPSTSSTESTPKVAFRFATKGAVKPAQEVVCTSGRQSEGEAEEIAVSCGDLQSLIMPEDCTWISREYGLKEVEPDDMERPHTPSDGYVALSERYLQFKVRLPLYPFFVEVI